VLGGESEAPANGIGELVAIYDLLLLPSLGPSFALPGRSGAGQAFWRTRIDAKTNQFGLSDPDPL
jgi:hypothetical protein